MASQTLNLDVGNLITGANVIDGKLYWTDNRNEPRKIDIARFRDEGDHTSGTTQIYGRDFVEEDITVIKVHPTAAATIATTASTTDDSPFEDVYPRISYRWKYNDNEYTPFAPFTEAVFVGDEWTYEDLYKTGNIEGCKNNLASFTATVPVGNPDTTKIELLYTETISQTVYIIDEHEITSSDRTAGTVTFTVEGRNYYKALPQSQLNRQFDEVPKLAKAQEIIGNRLIYGNYTEKFDLPSLTAVLDTVDNGGATTKTFKQGVRFNATYSVGVVLMDKFGRQSGLIDLGQVSTPFAATETKKLKARLSGTLPSWVDSYKYYVKDITGQRHNMKAFGIFPQEGEGENPTHLWLAVTSKDVNKVEEGDTIYHRGLQEIDTFPGYAGQANNNYLGVKTAFWPSSRTLNRRKVLEIENEAPDSVKYGTIDRRLLTSVRSITTPGYFGEGASGWAHSYTPAAGDNFVVIKDTGDSVVSQFGDEIGAGKGVYITLGNNTSNKVRVESIDKATNVPITGGTSTVAILNLAEELIAADVSGVTSTSTIQFYTGEFDTEKLAALNGMFFVKTTREPLSGTDILPYDQVLTLPKHVDSANTGDGVTVAFFEIEANEKENVDIYYESAGSFDATADFGIDNTIPFTNAMMLVNGTNGTGISIDKHQDTYNGVRFGKGVRVNTPEDDYQEDVNTSGLIFSGILNPNTGFNAFNNFSKADGITKQINPKYGSIQKLYAADDLVTFCENRVLRVLANKDALFNADESMNLIANPNVLGQAIAYNGKYGISTNPESFATYGYNMYFTDRVKGCVLQLTPANGQIFEISGNGMRDFFRDRISSCVHIHGAYDRFSSMYMLTMERYNPNEGYIDSNNLLTEEVGVSEAYMTLGYLINGDGGWVSRYSFHPEWGISLDGKFYTYKNGKIYLHNSLTADHNNFYGTQYNSECEFIFNDNPTVSSEWVSLNYEGTAGWNVIKCEADQEDNIISDAGILDDKWFKKEGKYFGSIVGTEDVYTLVFNGVPDADGNYPLQDSGQNRDVAGVKGFFNKVRLRNEETTRAELFAVSAEYYISSY